MALRGQDRSNVFDLAGSYVQQHGPNLNIGGVMQQ
jgi:hypothetical protein